MRSMPVNSVMGVQPSSGKQGQEASGGGLRRFIESDIDHEVVGQRFECLAQILDGGVGSESTNPGLSSPMTVSTN